MLILEGFTDLEVIGRGGLGDVYRATAERTGATVAVKVLRDVADESIAWHRTRRELTALVALGGHAHVIQLLGLLEDRPGLVMEFAPGGSVGELMAHRDLTIAETVMIGRQTASALAAAHARGIVHRDVKPQNLLIDAYGQVRLCDFGIASLARTEEFRTRTSAISLRYASPEDLEEDTEVGPPADVYSLGATLLHLTHGAPPTLKERLAPWQAPPTEDPVLAELDDVVASCLQPEPGRRPNVSEVLERLDAIPSDCHSLPVAQALTLPAENDTDPDESTDPTVLHTGRRRKEPARPSVDDRPRRWPALAGAAAVALLLGFMLLRPDRADAPSYSVVDRPDDLTAIDDATITWPFGAVGVCLVQVPESDTLRDVDCGEPHDLQRFAIGEVDDTDRFDDLADELAQRCPRPAGIDALTVAWSTPSAQAWSDGDRQYQCLIGAPGRRVIGSVIND